MNTIYQKLAANRKHLQPIVYVEKLQEVCTVHNPYTCKDCVYFTNWKTKSGTGRCKLNVSKGIKMGVLADGMACFQFVCSKNGYEFEHRVCNVGQEEKKIYN